MYVDFRWGMTVVVVVVVVVKPFGTYFLTCVSDDRSVIYSIYLLSRIENFMKHKSPLIQNLIKQELLIHF